MMMMMMTMVHTKARQLGICILSSDWDGATKFTLYMHAAKREPRYNMPIMFLHKPTTPHYWINRLKHARRVVVGAEYYTRRQEFVGSRLLYFI